MPLTLAQLAADVIVQGADKAKTDLKDIGTHAEGTGGKLKGMIGNMLSMAGGIAIASAVSGAFHLVADNIGDMVKAGMEANQVQAQTEAGLKSTGGAAGMTSKAVGDLATNLMNLTGIDDDTVQSAENMLLTFTNIHKNVFPAATQAVADLATKMSNGAVPSAQAMQAASIQLGKALNDPVHGYTALQRVGVTFTEQQKDQIKQMMSAGDVAGAQNVILKEMNKEFGGSAEAAGKANGGMAILTAQLNNMKQTVGQAIIPVLGQLMTALSPIIAGLVGALPGALQTAGSWLSFFGNMVQQIGGVFISIVKPGLNALGDAFDAVGKQINGLDFSEIVQTGKLLAATFGFMLRDAFVTVAGAIKSINWSAVLDGANSVGQAVLAFAQYVQANVLPVIQQLAGFIMSDVLPAVKQFGDFIMANIVPALAQLFEWASANVVPIVEKLAKIFITNVLPALEQVWQSIAKNLVPALEHAWEAIAPKLIPILEKLGAFLKNVIAPIIANVVVPVLGFLIARIGDVAGFLLGFIDGALGAFGAAWTGLSTLIGNVWNGIVGIVRDGVNSVIDQINQVIDLANHIPGVHFDHIGHVTFGLPPTNTDKGSGGSATVSAGGHRQFASGGYAPGGPILVGDGGGPELVVGPHIMAPPRGSRIYNANETANLLNGNGGGGSGHTFHIHVHQTTATAKDIMDEVAWQLRLRG